MIDQELMTEMCRIVKIFKHLSLCKIHVDGKGKTDVNGEMPVHLPVSNIEWSQFVCVDDNS
jgi:hypothetical protein